MSDQWFAAVQRYVNKVLADTGLLCQGDGPEVASCRHCIMRNKPGLIMRRKKFPPLGGPDPVLAFKETDAFIVEYFDRLTNDVESPIGMLQGSYDSFVKCLVQAFHGRVFFTTAQGFMGIGPRSARVGDKVAILAGGRVPFLLRETDLASIVGLLDVAFIKRYFGRW